MRPGLRITMDSPMAKSFGPRLSEANDSPPTILAFENRGPSQLALNIHGDIMNRGCRGSVSQSPILVSTNKWDAPR